MEFTLAVYTLHKIHLYISKNATNCSRHYTNTWYIQYMLLYLYGIKSKKKKKMNDVGKMYIIKTSPFLNE